MGKGRVEGKSTAMIKTRILFFFAISVRLCGGGPMLFFFACVGKHFLLPCLDWGARTSRHIPKDITAQSFIEHAPTRKDFCDWRAEMVFLLCEKLIRKHGAIFKMPVAPMEGLAFGPSMPFSPLRNFLARREQDLGFKIIEGDCLNIGGEKSTKQNSFGKT